MLISASEISKFHNEKCILDNVSFSIEENDKIALVGVNGVGKSTFLKILAGKETYEGKMIYKSNLQISYLAQDDDFDDDRTIFEVVQERTPKCEDFEIRSVLTKLKIDDLDKKIGTCSGGQRKRVAGQ